MHSAGAAVLCMMAAQGFDAFSNSGLYSNHQVSQPCKALLARSLLSGQLPLSRAGLKRRILRRAMLVSCWA